MMVHPAGRSRGVRAAERPGGHPGAVVAVISGDGPVTVFRAGAAILGLGLGDVRS